MKSQTTNNDIHSHKTVRVVTLGCSKNVVDSETLMGLLRQNNHQTG